MPVKQVLLDLLSNYSGIALQSCVILIAQFGRNLVADMYKLAEIRIVKRVFAVMAKGTGILLAGPRFDLRGRRQLQSFWPAQVLFHRPEPGQCAPQARLYRRS